MDKKLLPIVLALGWHTIDATLHMTHPHKRVRMVWAGVGVGWSFFWLMKNLPKQRWTVIKEWSLI